MAIQNDGGLDQTAFDSYKQKFSDAVNNDLNTAMGLSVLFDLIKDKDVSNATKLKLIEDFDKVLGLDLLKKEETNDSYDISTEEIETLIEKRVQAKQNKDYKLADEIRNELLSKGIKLIDTPTGTKYEKV